METRRILRSDGAWQWGYIHQNQINIEKGNLRRDKEVNSSLRVDKAKDPIRVVAGIGISASAIEVD